MSSIVNECTLYQAHAWKKDICTNCMKSKGTHSKSVIGGSTTSQVNGSSQVNGAAGKPVLSPKHTGSNVTNKKVNSKTENSGTSKKSAGSQQKENVTSPSRRTYNYGGYRSTMKRDNDSTDSQLSVKSNSSDKSTKSNRSVNTGYNRSKVKRGDSKDSVLSDKSPTTANGDKNIEQALKTLTCAAKGSPKCGRKGSRTTMNYGATGSSNNNSSTSSPTESSSSCVTVNNSVNNSNMNKSNSSWLHGNKLSSKVNIPLDKNVGKLTASITPQKHIVAAAASSRGTQQNTAVKTDPSTGTAGSCLGNSLLKSRDKCEVKTDTGSKNSNVNSKIVEKRQVLIDKGRLSTEKIIFDKSTVVCSGSKDSKVKSSINKTVITKRPSKEELCTARRPSKEELCTAVNTKIQQSNKKNINKDNKLTTGQRSVSGIKGQSTLAKRSTGESVLNPDKSSTVYTSSNVSKKTPIATPRQNTTDTGGKNTRQTSTDTDSKNTSPKGHSDSREPEYKAGSKVTRKKSKTSRPPCPPPSVPPTGSIKGPACKAMMESYHSDMSESQSYDSQLGATDTKITVSKTVKNGEDDSFSDLYNDILNSLSEVKDITPDLLNKLKADGPADKKDPREKHYYHKYDVSNTKRDNMAESLTLSSALGTDGSSSIIIETMNTSFHAGSGDGEVEDITAQTLAMPYNIVDVSTILPRGKSPRLPATPAPESRNSTLNRSTLNKMKRSSCSSGCSSNGSNSPVVKDKVVKNKNKSESVNKGDSISLDDSLTLDTEVLPDAESLQGLHPRFWHTYEPIDVAAEAQAKQQKQQNKPAWPNNDKKQCSDKESFIRQTAVRSTAPVRGVKTQSTNIVNNSIAGNKATETTASLAHLDLQHGDGNNAKSNISKSAEDLLDDMTDSLGEPKKRKNSGKKKNGSGFFRRLFGIGRKSSADLDEDLDEEDNVDGATEGTISSIQENAEFFKPLKVDTNLSPSDKDVFEMSPSPTKKSEVGSPNLVSEIENAMFERKLTPKDLTLVIPSNSTSQKVVPTGSKQSMDITSKKATSPIEPYGTSKDFIFIRNEKDINRTSESKSSPPPIPTTNPRTTTLSNKPVLSPKPGKLTTRQSESPTHNKALKITKNVSISNSPEHGKSGLTSPGRSIGDNKVSGSVSQTSLLSDGSSDCRSISSREEQGSSGDSRELNRDARPRKPRPKSQAVSRKMLDAPPPPPPGSEKRRSSELSSPTGAPTSPRFTDSAPSSGESKPSPPKTSPTSPTKSLSNPLAKLTSKGKAKRQSFSEDTYDIKKPSSPKKIEISGPMLQSSTLNSSQTLPRPVKKPMVDNVVKESLDDLAATGRRKMDSVAKHARNKTVTEGVKFDISLLNNDGESERLAELLDNKTTSKFVNRALPPTPADDQQGAKPNGILSHRKTESGDYEWMNVEGIQLVRRSKSEKSTYEATDEDIYTDPIESTDDTPTSGRKKSPLKAQVSLPGRLTVGSSPSLKAPPSAFTDYLLPVEMAKKASKPTIACKPLIYGDEKGTLVKNTLSLGPKPSGLQPLQGDDDKNKETYVSMIYVNTEMIMDKTRPPLDVGEGFRRMAFINVETLLHIANTIVTGYLHPDAKIVEDLKFSHFILKSTRPYVHQGCVAYYNARTYKLKPNECMLMISAKYINPDLLHHTCVHLLQPSLIFSDKILATYFPDININKSTHHASTCSTSTALTLSSKVYQLGGMVQTNMAVITYHSIHTLENYIQDVLRKRSSNGEAFERNVCYLLYQVLNGVLSSHDGTSVYVIKTVKVDDILVVTHAMATDQQYLVINPLSSGEIEIMEEEVLCSDLIELLCKFLDITTATTKVSANNIKGAIVANMDCAMNYLKSLTVEALKKLEGKSKYILGLKKMVEVLKGGNISSIVVARSIIEYTLWGPTDKEIKSLLQAEDRGQAFCIWLEVTRCKGANELALGQLVKNLELAHMFHYLCTVTGSAMLDVTKLLYKQK